ncbi:MAG: hypothetical protein ACKVVP_03925, partial [Chloroflexota bacterium]
MTELIQLDHPTTDSDDLKQNLGTRPIAKLRPANYPDAGPAIRAARGTRQHNVDVLLVNPPSPDGA